MRALQLLETGTIAVTDIPEPEAPGPGEVTVEIGAVALNHLDVWSYRGMAFAKRKLPLVVGAEAAGTIVAVGPDMGERTLGNRTAGERAVGEVVALYGARTCGHCRPCREGRDNLCENPGGVHGFHLDGFARERVTLPARQCIPVPAGCSVTAAAVTPVTYGTSEHMLFDNARLEPGETVLVQAGGSGVGSAAILLAKALDCTVVTTAGSDAKCARALELGADHAINYNDERFERAVRKLTGKRGVDVVFEHVGKSTWEGSLLSLRPGGRLVTCGSTSGVSAPTNLMMLFQRQLRLIGSFGCRMENVATSLAKLADGRVRPVIDATIGLGEVDACLDRMEARDVFGKIVLDLGR